MPEERRRHILVVANETVGGRALIDAVKRHAAEGPILVTVICPINNPREGYVVYEDTRRAAAGRRLERTLEMLREAGIAAHGPGAERRVRRPGAGLRAAGIDAHGQVAHPDPYTAAMHAVRDERVDEIIVSTFPQTKSGWLRRDLVARLSENAGMPVEHIVV